ncbi:MAG: GNAT family N-acetyltransferase [Roseovarius sp.]|nr:GNAT family N-acetyltransferase [Roseovarius sp.]
MTADISIRPLREDDHADWLRLWTAYLDFYETELPQDVIETAFSRLLSGRPGEFQGLIAEIDGRPVGLAHFLFHRILWSVEDTCYLMDLFSDPETRGRGVGRALIEAVHAAARAAGIPGVYWQTQEFNYKGRMLYDKVATRTPFIIYEKNA